MRKSGLTDRLHEESQELTGALDTEIGFPLDQTPDYADLNPKFFERFHTIACRVLGVSATPRTTGETTVEAQKIADDVYDFYCNKASEFLVNSHSFDEFTARAIGAKEVWQRLRAATRMEGGE